MDSQTQEIVKQLVFKACQEHPEMLRPIIDIATEGVKSFADKQMDNTSKMSFMMSQILDQYPYETSFGPFDRKEILERIRPQFDGTPWFKKEMDRL
jgi:hypothetical protein